MQLLYLSVVDLAKEKSLKVYEPVNGRVNNNIYNIYLMVSISYGCPTKIARMLTKKNSAQI